MSGNITTFTTREAMMKKSSKSISVFKRTNSKIDMNKDKLFDAPELDVKTNQKPLREYQKEMLRAHMAAKGRYICIAPTGSGKSHVMVTRAAMNYKKGISTFILTPKQMIVNGFSHTGKNAKTQRYGDGYDDLQKFAVKFDGTTYELPPYTIRHVTGCDQFEIYLKDSQNPKTRQIAVGCYTAFADAYKKCDQLDRSKIEVIVDEAHHIFVDPLDQETNNSYNNLGLLVRNLLDHGAMVALYTATAYRADGGKLVQDSDNFMQFRRTLCEHFVDPRGWIDERGKKRQFGYCPEMNINFRFYDTVTTEQYEACESKSEQLIIGDVRTMIMAYADQYDKAPNRPTLMIIPSQIKNNGKNGVSVAARMAVDLEAELRKRGHTNILNLGGLETGQLVATNPAIYTERQGKLYDEELRVVISIKTADEGVDWPRCEVVFIPRVPKSLPLIVQRIGRALRPKDWSPKSDISEDRKSTRLNSSHLKLSRMPSSA